MEFQFNFSIDKAAESSTDTAENEQPQQEMVLLNNQENGSKVASEGNQWSGNSSGTAADGSDHRALKASPDARLSRERQRPKSARMHDIPKDASRVLGSKTIAALPGVGRANVYVVEAALPGDSIEGNITPGASSRSDLVTGVYEGGLKVWECTFDLLDYFSEAGVQFAQKSVLDLGCGAGLLGIAALRGNAQKVHFQDYNGSVIEGITVPNILANDPQDDDDGGDQDTQPHLDRSRGKNLARDFLPKCKFFSGEWSEFCKLLLNTTEPLVKYDLILTSETIYNPSYYEAFHDALSSLLARGGTVFLASKAHYFGCGGGIHLFTSFLAEKDVFQSQVVKVIDKGLKRFILELTFKDAS